MPESRTAVLFASAKDVAESDVLWLSYFYVRANKPFACCCCGVIGRLFDVDDYLLWTVIPEAEGRAWNSIIRETS